VNSRAALPPKSPRFKCRDCDYTGPSPIVKPVANPVTPDHGRCSNREACRIRQLRRDNKAKVGKS
jgi:hypothetical protein